MKSTLNTSSLWVNSSGFGKAIKFEGIRGLKPYTALNGEILVVFVDYSVICKLNMGKILIPRFVVSFQIALNIVDRYLFTTYVCQPVWGWQEVEIEV